MEKMDQLKLWFILVPLFGMETILDFTNRKIHTAIKNTQYIAISTYFYDFK